MDMSRGGACASDASRIKNMILDFVAAVLPGQRLDPPLSTAASKELSRGWNHPQLAALLMPAKLLGDYKANRDE
jgi:hypothetical protein